jgi:2-polyprenyl-3-methyl-5-hydroxy-6-metoxy-1,4-benzoquinol methylase
VSANPAFRARRLVGQVVRRAARPALAGPGSPVQELRDRVDHVERAYDSEAVRAELRSIGDRILADVDARTSELRDGVLALLRERDDAQAELIHALEALRRRVGALEHRADDAERADARLAERLPPLETFVARATALPFTDAAGLTVFDEPDVGRVLGFRDAGDGARGDRYLAFEDVFRGSEERVRELQRPYLAIVGDRAPVLDVGCGRGELLELLRDAGVEAAGADTDAGMVERCRAKGLAVERADAVEALRAREDGSLGVVFSAQVVEHLPYPVLEELLAMARAKLRPGGLLIAETVNPHAADALKAFWLDPTHEHPLFPEVMLTLARIAGFGSGWVLHPNGTGDVERDRFAQPAYALVARRDP